MSEEAFSVPGVADTKKEKFFFHNTLTCLVKALEAHYCLIDLRNESSIAGRIIGVDGYMNIEMEDVIYMDSKGNEHAFDSFYIRHRSIRYVHIPETLSSLDLIQEQLNGMKRIKPTKHKRTYKQVRAEKYQRQLVNCLNK